MTATDSAITIAAGFMMKLLKIILVSLAIVPLGGIGYSVAAQQRPLLTEDVDIIPPGTVRIEAGIDFLQGAKFPVSGISGDLTRVGVIGVNFGLGPNV